MRLPRCVGLTTAIAGLLAAAIVADGTGSAAAATKPKPKPVVVVKPVGVVLPQTFFGVHFQGASTNAQWPAKTLVGSVRLWDSGTNWEAVQPTATTYNWSPLDLAVAHAKARRVDPTIVLGPTPLWASSNPTQVPQFGPPGSAAMPTSMVLWRRYVQAVVDRYYRKGVRSIQTWNEPNSGFWLGTVAQMASLNLAAYQVVHQTVPKKTVVTVLVKGKPTKKTVIKRVPKYPGLLLVSPGLSTRRPAQRTWLASYFKLTNARYVDVLALHLYPQPTGKPEDAAAQFTSVLPFIKAAKLTTKPLWNTEVNYGGPIGGSGTAPVVIPPPLQAAYVSRTLLLNAAVGVSRMFWYGWDAHGSLGVDLTAADNVSLTPAGKAWAVTRGWLTLPFAGCTKDKLGTYRCVLVPRKGTATVIWNPTRKLAVATVKPATVVGLDSKRKVVKAKGKVAITSSPVLVTTAS